MCALAINCPKCGAPITFPVDGDETICGYCGNSVIIPREKGKSNLEKIQEAEVYVQRGWDANYLVHPKQALRFFSKAVELDPENLEAWTGKGIAILYKIGMGYKVSRVALFGDDVSQVIEFPKEHMKEAEEALRCFHRACKLGINEVALKWRKQLALALGKWHELCDGSFE